MVVDGGEEAITEELAWVPGDAQVMFDVACGLFEVQGFEVEADGDALVEGLEGCEAELVSEASS